MKFVISQAKFYNAIKTAQRAVEEIVKRDEKQMTEILTASRDISKQLEQYYNRTQNIDTLVMESRAPDLIHDEMFRVSLIIESCH